MENVCEVEEMLDLLAQRYCIPCIGEEDVLCCMRLKI